MATPTANSDLISASVRDRLDAKLPDEWFVYKRRDFNIQPADEFPACYAVSLSERILEEETDNQVLVGYPIGVALLIKKAAVEVDYQPLNELRRLGQQAVYTTDYTGLAIEQILLEEGLSAPLPSEDEGYLTTGFTIVIGILEPREV